MTFPNLCLQRSDSYQPGICVHDRLCYALFRLQSKEMCHQAEMASCLQRGYHVFWDYWFTSIGLARELLSKHDHFESGLVIVYNLRFYIVIEFHKCVWSMTLVLSPHVFSLLRAKVFLLRRIWRQTAPGGPPGSCNSVCTGTSFRIHKVLTDLLSGAYTLLLWVETVSQICW